MKVVGNIEAEQYKISSKLAGRISNINVSKGEKVIAGQDLFEIDSPELTSKLIQAKANYDAALAVHNNLILGSRSENIASAEAQVLSAKESLNFAQDNFNRSKALFDDGVISKQKFEQSKLSMTTASSAHKIAENNLSLAYEGPQQGQREASKAKVVAADAVYDEVNELTKELQVHSIANDYIDNIYAKKGELIPAGYPIMTVTNIQESYVVFDVKESIISNYSLNSVNECDIPSLNLNGVNFKISRISKLPSFANWVDSSRSDNISLHTYRIEAKLLQHIDDLLLGSSVIL
ncbi:HlyD family secretion protein [Photobacterium leiognathi]|uniref:HlyD family secretion protein n=1 Tax=Photobacterium leiognathi TaxID=553611 RepID=UPI0030C7DA26